MENETELKVVSATRGRKPKHESEADTLRRKLIEWRDTPESIRPSLRALASQLNTSHQLLSFYLRKLDLWQAQQLERVTTAEHRRLTDELFSRANREGRTLNQCERDEFQRSSRTMVQNIARMAVLDQICRFEETARTRPLLRSEISILKVYVRYGHPRAQALLQKCSVNSAK